MTLFSSNSSNKSQKQKINKLTLAIGSHKVFKGKESQDFVAKMNIKYSYILYKLEEPFEY